MSIGRTIPKAGIDTDVVSLQWSNGKTMARTTPSARFGQFIGWTIEVGKNKDLDSILDEIAFPKVEIKHQRQGSYEIKSHWSFGEDISILPITSGPVSFSMRECLSRKNKPLMAQAGIGVRWTQGERSKLVFRCFVRPLWDVGFEKFAQVSAKSNMTDKLIAALADHTRVSQAADAFVKDGVIVSPADLWLPLGAGEEDEFGKGEVASVFPMISKHPAEPNKEYFKSIWRTTEQRDAVLNVWRETQEWAAAFAEEPEVRESFDRGTGEVYDSRA